MARPKLVRSKTLPYHLVARTNNRDPFYANLSDVWETLCKLSFAESTIQSFQVHAFVLMPNHFHMLASTPESDLGVIMNRWISFATKLINQKTNRSGRVFGARYFRSLITSPLYYAHALKYVYRNPVKASLCGQAHEYEFSTLKGIVGEGSLRMKLSPSPFQTGSNTLIPNNAMEMLNWINTPYKKEHDDQIRRGLKHPEFRLSAPQKDRKLSALERSIV